MSLWSLVYRVLLMGPVGERLSAGWALPGAAVRLRPARISHRRSYPRPLSRGSRASRRPSPSRLKASTVSMMAMPGKKTR